MFENDEQKWRKIKHWILFAAIITLLLTKIPSVSASTIAEATIQIFPKEGDIYTNIIVKVRGEPYSPSGDWGNYVTDRADYPRLYLYYDDICLVQRMACVTAPGIGSYSFYYCSWDVNITVPNKYPYSNLGVHNITAVIEASDGTKASATATFTIINYYPPADLFWMWWNSLNSTIQSQLRGPQGPQGPSGPAGPQGVQGERGPQGEPGKYPIEILILNLSISILAVIISVIALHKVKRSIG